MNGSTVTTIIFLLLAAIEGFNGVQLAFRAKHALASAKLSYHDGPGLLVQEFGVYSLAIAVAYLMAAVNPVRFWSVAVVGSAINLAAGAMHLLRSCGIYFGDVRPLTSRGFERKAVLVHTLALLALFIPLLGGELINRLVAVKTWGN